MNVILYNPEDTTITRDQSLSLQSMIIAYFREALVYDKGYVVLEVVDIENYIFDFYHSDGRNVNAKYEETREETVNKIMFTINCEEIKKDNNIDINAIIKHLYNYIIGYVSINALYEQHNVKDHSSIFRTTENLSNG